DLGRPHGDGIGVVGRHMAGTRHPRPCLVGQFAGRLAARPPRSHAEQAAVSTSSGEVLLDIQDLQASFLTDRGFIRAVDGVSFSVRRGETLGLVGESGSGKTITCLSILRLLPKATASITGGRVLFEGSDLLQKSETEMHAIR